MSAPKVVIGLPVYNGQKHVEAAIESHLSQSYGDFMLVVADNGSTDATPDIAARFEAADKRVKLWRSPENRGILWNHRRVLEAITAPDQYFRWAGGDDIIEPGFLQLMVTVLDERRDAASVMPNTKNIDDDGKLTGTMPRVLDIQSPDVVQRAHDLLMARYQHVIAYGLLRQSVLADMRTKPLYPGWDEVFAWELVLRGKMVQPDGPALLRRFHPGSISKVKTVKEMRKWVEPNAKAGMSFPHWTWAHERLRVLLRAPMTQRERMRIGLFLLRFTSWHRAALLRDITQATKRGLGLSDEYTF